MITIEFSEMEIKTAIIEYARLRFAPRNLGTIEYTRVDIDRTRDGSIARVALSPNFGDKEFLQVGTEDKPMTRR